MEDDVRQMKNQRREDIEGYNKGYRYDYPYEKYDYSMQKAAQQVAAKIDQDLLNTLNIKAKGKLKGF